MCLHSVDIRSVNVEIQIDPYTCRLVDVTMNIPGIIGNDWTRILGDKSCQENANQIRVQSDITLSVCIIQTRGPI